MKTVPIKELKRGDIIYAHPDGLSSIASGAVIAIKKGHNWSSHHISYIPNKLDYYGGDRQSWYFDDPIQILEKDEADLILLGS
jgi:hypothetical protein